jgi:hypothetical protein
MLLSPEELLKVSTLATGSRSSLDLINEDREGTPTITYPKEK